MWPVGLLFIFVMAAKENKMHLLRKENFFKYWPRSLGERCGPWERVVQVFLGIFFQTPFYCICCLE
jgi:hypothetical protein